MKKHSVLGLILLTACSAIIAAACGSDDTQTPPGMVPATGGATNTGGMATSTGGMATTTGGLPGMGGTNAGGTGGTGGDIGGTGGTGGVCEMPSLEVFAESNTEEAWDDNDFSDVVLEGSCPALATVTWPHEADWENGDPAEANREPVRFTLDSYYSNDLTGKQLNVTVELTDDMRGPNATAGGYVVSLVSVSTYDRIVLPTGGTSGAGGAEAGSGGATAGSGGSGGTEAGSGGATAGSGGSADPCSSAGAGGLMAGAGGVAGSAGASGAGAGSGGVAGGGGRGGGGRAGGGRGGGGAGGRGGGGGVAGSGGVAGLAGASGAGSGGVAGLDAGGLGGVAGGGGTGGEPPMTTTGYSEAISAIADRRTLYRVGDRATVSFVLPNKTAEVDSYDPTRPIKINVRIETVYSACDMPMKVYDYLLSQFAITSLTITDAP